MSSLKYLAGIEWFRGRTRTINILVIFVMALLCSVNTYGEDENVSGPELVWRLFEPQPECVVKGMVRGKDGSFIIALDRTLPTLDSSNIYFESKDIVLCKIDSQGSKAWEIFYGDEGRDDFIESAASTNDGGIILAIRSRLPEPDESDESTLYLVKVDEWGNSVWEKTLNERGWSNLNNIILCSDGGLFAAGTSGGGDLRVMRMNKNGEKLWENLLLSHVTGVHCVVNTEDGGFIVAGSKQTPPSYQIFGFLVRFDASGNRVWEKTLRGGETNPLLGIVRSRDYGYIVTRYLSVLKIDGEGEEVWEKYYRYGNHIIRAEGGYIVTTTSSERDPPSIYKMDEDGNKIWEKEYLVRMWWNWYSAAGIIGTGDYGFVLSNTILGDPHAWKINSEGEIIWDRLYGDTRRVNDLALSPDGGCVEAGVTQFFGYGTWDAYLSRRDYNGNRLWEKTYGGPGWESAECITGTGDGGYIAAGYSTSYGDQDVYIFKIDGEGNMIWEYTYGTLENETVIDIAPNGDGGFIVLGNTESYIDQTSYVYLLKVDSQGRKIWDKNLDQYPHAGYVKYREKILSTDDSDFIIILDKYQNPTDDEDFHLLRIDRNGQILWDKTYSGYGLQRAMAGSGDRFLVTSRYGPTYMIDGAGDKIWEKENYFEELNQLFKNTSVPISRLPDNIGGMVVVSCCDGGFILLCPYRGDIGDWFLWRIDDKGEILWATRMSEITGTNFPDHLLVSVDVVRGRDGTFISTVEHESPWTWFSILSVIKFRDPELIGAECDSCQDLYPELWEKINDKLTLAENLIDATKQKGTDTTIIQLMEQEYQNAENAQKTCDLESAKMHLDWIIQAAPEPCPLAFMLLMPFFWVWKRTGFCYN